MAYTRPDYDAADAGWLPAPYTRPDYDAADATFYVPSVSNEFYLTDSGLPSPPTIQMSPVATFDLSDSGLPSAPSIQFLNGKVFWLADGGLPGVPSIYMAKGIIAWLADSGLPAAPTAAMYTDPTPYINPSAPIFYVVDLLDENGLVTARVPISSWQATLQTASEGYVQCTVPSCSPWLDAINAASEFRISRVGRLLSAYGGGEIESPIVQGPVQTVQVSQGPTNHTSVISGYISALPANEDPDELFDRELTGVRSITTYGPTISIRCEIDWLLRPGQRAVYGTVNFSVSYINYYVTSYGRTMDAYMDIGYRAPS
ncbi:hypothetical protein [Caudoviricetes sp.]|nr:hypothetical protein [Caudoviricetes sp.]